MTRKTLMMTTAIMLYGSAALASVSAPGSDLLWIDLTAANDAEQYIVLASADDDSCDDDAGDDACDDDSDDDEDDDDDDDDDGDDDGGDDSSDD